jgi:hypothetical protein
MRYALILLLYAALIPLNDLYGQGCSDAGFCTMGAMRPDQAYSSDAPLRFRFADLSYYRGETKVSATIEAIIFDVGFEFGKNYNLHLKVPYMMVRGNFAQTQGVGDISLSVSRNVARWRDFDFNTTLGAKLPSGRSDLRHEAQDVVLPMYYQITLGTYDFVMGGSLINEKWLFSAGYQQPLIHINENTFDNTREAWWGWYPGGMDYVRKHASATNLRRGADVMVRIERNWRFSRFNYNVGLLPIYRVTSDQIMDREGNYFKPEGARGLAASLLLGCGYRLNTQAAFKMLYGLRLVERAYNPDGLTRDQVLNLTFNYQF